VKIFVVFMALLLSGCSKILPTSETVDEVKITLSQAYPPEFERIYKFRIETPTRTVELTITAQTFLGSRMVRGELTQSNGRWILFDPDQVAEKIIDRELVPIVQEKCNEILRVDKNFVDSKPDRFKDTSGDTWIRQAR